MKKTLHNSDDSGTRENVLDVVIYGDDLWHLLCKASSEAEGWMKSTKVMEIAVEHGLSECRTVRGCLVQVTTQQGDHVAEALTYVTDVKLSADGERLVAVY